MNYLPLRKVADIERSMVAAEQIQSGVLYVGLEHMTGQGEFVNVAAVDAGELGSPKFAFGPEHILFGKLRPYLKKTAQPTFAGVCSTEIVPIRPKNSTNIRFLLHFLRWQRTVDEATSLCAGANLPRLSPSLIEEILVPALSPATQMNFADLLDRADAIRRKRRQALKLVDELVRATFLEMFGDPVVNSKHWPQKSLKQLGFIKTGGTPPGGAEGMFGGNIPFVTPGDLESGEMAKRTVTEAGADAAACVRAGATLVCCIGATIGKIGQTRERSAFNQQINAVEWFSEVDDIFGFQCLTFFKARIAQLGTSTTLPILNKSSFEKIMIPVPPPNLQLSYNRLISKANSARTSSLRSLADADTLFASLQNQAFGGIQ